MRIQHNISALNTYRQLSTNNTGTSKALEKLSSGYRINRAGDDAAGLAISEKMRAQINGLNRASANAQDGISLIQAAEGALQETHSILQRMRELSVQAANDVNETEDRQAIQDEIDQLKTEVDRIAYTTEFNKKTLLDGSLSKDLYATKLLAGRAVLAGAHVDQAIASNLIDGGTVVEDLYTVAVTKEGVVATDTYKFDLTGMAVGDTIAIGVGFDNVATDLPGGDVMTDTAQVFTYTATGVAEVDNAAFINGLREALGKVIDDYTITNSGNNITFTAKGVGAAYDNVSIAATVSGPGGTANGTPALDGDQVFTAAGDDAEITITKASDGSETTVDTTVDGASYIKGVFTDTGTGLVFEIGDLTRMSSSIVQVKGGKDLTLQVGANTGRDQAIDIAVTSMSASSLGIDNLDVSNHISSQGSLASIENAIQIVSAQRAGLGAVQNRLEHTTANLDTVAENLQAAESRIRDVDMAKEMMNFTKFNILVQASQAMMAQANAQPQGVLQLLR